MNLKPNQTFIFLYIVLFNSILFSQASQLMNSSEIILALEKLNTLSSVLYLAAHPDDENTGVLAYFSKGEKYRTGYLALTRGDGGQNLIGSETGEQIGIIRTQELLEARKIDGAEQFFTRAIDFGYSKSPEETFKFWGKESILSDVVWVIRNFKPDIIITRFPIDGSGGHGHHTASAILAEEAFYAAADSTKFIKQLKFVKPWQTKSLYWNKWRPNPEETIGLLNIDIGQYNPLFAESYSELAAKSRSMHKSQGFGATGRRGTNPEYFEFFAGDKPLKNLFENIDTTWNRVEGSLDIQRNINIIIKTFNPQKPSDSLPQLNNLFTNISGIKNNYWVDQKKKELLKIIQSCAGLWFEAIADDYSTSPGNSINISTTLVIRSNSDFTLKKLIFENNLADTSISLELQNNNPVSINSKIFIPLDYQISQPYWLMENNNGSIFEVNDQKLIGLSENPASVSVTAKIKSGNSELEFNFPLLYRWNDRVKGELYRTFEIRPPVVASIDKNVLIFSNNNENEIKVKLKSNTENISGKFRLNGNLKWKVTPTETKFSFNEKYEEKNLTFKITPPNIVDEAYLVSEIIINDKKYNNDLIEISYDHIPTQTYFPESKIKVVKMDLNKFDDTVGYIMGAGDEIPKALQNLGYKVILLDDSKLENENLQNYNAIITGIRAYNTRDRLKYYQPKLMEYVKNGGTLIVQYNVSFGLQTENIGPYNFNIGRDRVSEEDAEIKILDPQNPFLNYPNKITKVDFDNWIQARGLYFAENWDEKYTPIFSSHDTNESEKKGSLIYTQYGKGIFIYTGLSFFRELPAGVPGAVRLFVNLISAGKKNDK